MFKSSLALALLWVLLSASVPCAATTGVGRAAASPRDPAQYINPFVGTANSPLPDYLGGNGSGNTFPGATLPFGMIQWSPDTEHAFGKDERGSYLYRDTATRGFSLTHLSGPGCPVFGDVPIMPVVGALNVSPAADPRAYLASFSHADERAAPGSYEVALASGVRVALTVTERTGMGVFTYPRGSQATLLFDVGRNASGVSEASAEVTGDRGLRGSVTSGGFCGARNKYRLYFVAEFDRPFETVGTWSGARVTPGARAVRGPQTGAYVTFDAHAAQTVRVRVGLSYVSAENASLNLRTENAGWDFEAVRRRALSRWNDALGRIEVGGGEDAERRVFYTALYHTLLHPNLFSDTNGDYLGFDDRVHRDVRRAQYTNFSGWDIYRSEMPLVALLFPVEASDMMQSLVADAEQGGGLPIWPVANDESGAMYGDPSVPIIASAYAFGARSFDARSALRAMIRGATDPTVKSRSYPERKGLREYLRYGYIPMDATRDEWGNTLWGSPSIAQEYMIADFALAQFARAHGDAATAREMMRRAQFWTRLFDPRNRYIRGRYADGTWLPGFDFKANVYDPKLPWSPASHKSYVEGNAAQYTWMVPHNMRALFERIGGNDAVIRRLDDFFKELNAGPNRPYFFIGNEPVFAVPWAYDFAGAPWKTQAITRRALVELFTNDPGGLPGNDDLGATSSWIVWAAVGLYPVIPGVGGFALNSPLFPVTVVRLKDGKRLRIEGRGASVRTPYVLTLRLDGRPDESTWLPYERIARGATLDFTLGATPETHWASAPTAAPPSFEEGMEEAAGER